MIIRSYQANPPKHAWKYIGEFNYRRNYRSSHAGMFNRLVADKDNSAAYIIGNSHAKARVSPELGWPQCKRAFVIGTTIHGSTRGL